MSDKDEKAGGLCITLRPNRESFEIVTRTANLGKDEKTAKDMTDLLVLLEVLDNIRPFSNGFLGEKWKDELPERNRGEAVVCDIHQGDKLGQNFAVVFLKKRPAGTGAGRLEKACRQNRS